MESLVLVLGWYSTQTFVQKCKSKTSKIIMFLFILPILQKPHGFKSPKNKNEKINLAASMKEME